MISPEDLAEALENYDENEEGWEYFAEMRQGLKFDLPNIGEVVFVQHEELIGNEHILVFKFRDRWYAKEGQWVSHDGMYWEGDFRQVKPVQKVVTEWESV